MKPGHVFTIEPIFLMKNVVDDYILWQDRFTVISPNNISGKTFSYFLLIKNNSNKIKFKINN